MDLGLTFILRVLLFPGLAFIALVTALCDWVERKIEARMENRVGPAYTGPAGILQPFADIIKLLSKENITPVDVEELAFSLAPVISFATLVFAFLFLPVDGESVIPDSGFEGDLIFVFALVTIANFFMFISGWSSVNPYSAIGATRVLMQLLGYEIPLFLLALSPAFLARSLSISAIASAQRAPFAILAPWSFLLFLVTLQAEFERDPFDIPVAETEIVGGHETEYGGCGLAFLRLAKDVQTLLGAGVAVELFLGGPYGPTVLGLPELCYTFWFMLKVLSVVLVVKYMECVFARLRIDQVLYFNWKALLPLSALSLIATAEISSRLVGWG